MQGKEVRNLLFFFLPKLPCSRWQTAENAWQAGPRSVLPLPLSTHLTIAATFITVRFLLLETPLPAALSREFREFMRILTTFPWKEPTKIHHNSHKRPKHPNYDGFLVGFFFFPKFPLQCTRWNKISNIGSEKKTNEEKDTQHLKRAGPAAAAAAKEPFRT